MAKLFARVKCIVLSRSVYSCTLNNKWCEGISYAQVIKAFETVNFLFTLKFCSLTGI